jgi:transcription elongation factor Elf1
MDDLKFDCYNCNTPSPFQLTAANRDEVKRFVSDKTPGTANFICTNCEMVNEIELTLETAMKILQRLSSDDPIVNKAIDRAKQGDYDLALDVARKKLGF